VQVLLRQQAPPFLRAALERRQQPALKPLGQPPHPRPTQHDRPVAQAQPARLAEAVAVAARRIHRPMPLVPSAREQFVDFRFEHPLQELLHALPREGFQRLPGRA